MREEKRRKQKNSKMKILMILAGAALLLGAAAAVFMVQCKSDVLYRWKKDLQAKTAQVPLERAQGVETEQIRLEELLADERCRKDQSLLLINTDWRLSQDFEPQISYYADTDVLMNDCIQESYRALAAAVRERFDNKLYVREAYRTRQEQEEMVKEQSDTAAQVDASEHQAGLALDVYVPYYAGMAFIKSLEGRYVGDHACEYGFIIRYPSYGTNSTGIGYEPWHIRYVGTPHAQIIMKGCLTLEEYIELLEPGVMYQYEGFCIIRQEGEMMTVPADFTKAVVSEDNTGGWIMTFE